jgi:hypothetical protein
MYAGVIDKRVIYCCHPVFVVCRKGVAAGFTDLAEARKFLSQQGFQAGDIYTHDGADWYRIDVDPRRTAAPQPW